MVVLACIRPLQNEQSSIGEFGYPGFADGIESGKKMSGSSGEPKIHII